MKKVTLFSLILALAVTLWSCDDDSSPSGPDPDPNPFEEASAEKQFVWNAMNYWYYWQGDVPKLADSFNDDETEFHQYLKSFTDAEELFDNLQYKDDRFSFFIDNYEEYQNQQDGVRSALGFNYSFISFRNSDKIVGYVRYVIPGKPADEAGLERLQLFTEVDGTELNKSNYLGLLTDDSAHKLTLADIKSTNSGLSFPETGTVNIASREFTEDPIYKSMVIDTSGIKIGYLMYNAFQGNSHKDLNDEFGEFKSEGIDELVLDLRYNGGGAVITSQLLSSLISGLGSSDKFAEFTYNQKRSQQDESVYFLDKVPLQNEDGDFERNNQDEFADTEPINSLSLDKLYVLVGNSTASASEALINGLRPYINITVIGTKTVGKDQGSLTLYDAPAPYTNDEKANDDHKIAIQPIVLTFVNSEGNTYPDEYTNDDGITIDVFKPSEANNISEITVENLQNKPSIGSPEEPLLARAITLITGQQPKRKAAAASTMMEEVQLRSGIQDLRPYGNGMYIEPFMIPTPAQN